MKRYVLMFPGQGSQKVGMGKTFYDTYDLAKETFDLADRVLGFNLSKICFEGPMDVLTLTQNAQPAILTTSIAILRVLQERIELKPLFTAGHSLGEYSAVVASGGLSFEDALIAVHKRGKYMQDAVAPDKGAMAAVIGKDLSKVEEILSDIDGIVTPANYNSHNQIVISGEKGAVIEAMEVLKKERFRVIPLKVSAPFHCPLMKPAQDRLSEFLDQLKFNDLKPPVISNVTAEPVDKGDVEKKLLKDQVCSPVKWTQTLNSFRKQDVELLIEIGEGKVLSGLAKKTVPEIECISISDPSTLEKALEILNN